MNNEITPSIDENVLSEIAKFMRFLADQSQPFLTDKYGEIALPEEKLKDVITSYRYIILYSHTINAAFRIIKKFKGKIYKDKIISDMLFWRVYQKNSDINYVMQFNCLSNRERAEEIWVNFRFFNQGVMLLNVYIT